MGRRPYSPWKYNKKDRDYVNLLIDQFDLGQIRNKDFSQLSGGEKQLVILARTFAQNTNVLLCDEPNNNLDIFHIKRILCEIRQRTKTKKIISIIVLHDINIALKYCDQLLLLNKGKLFRKIDNLNNLSITMLEELYKVPIKIHYNEKGKIEFINTLT